MSKRAPQSERRRKLFLLVDEIGLERDERIDLSRYLLRRDINSWAELSEEQVGRLLDACEGFQLIVELLRQRPDSDRR